MEKKRKKNGLDGWEEVLRRFGYRQDPIRKIWINDELQSAWTEGDIRQYFSTTKDLEDFIVRYKTDEKFRLESHAIADQIANAELEFIGAGSPGSVPKRIFDKSPPSSDQSIH